MRRIDHADWKAKAIRLYGEGPGPCNYAGGGLFRMNPVTVVQEDGHETQVFEFAANQKDESEVKG